MKAQETTLQQLIQGEKQFVVPLYQRPYSWGQPQLEQLWSDIVEQADGLAAGEGGATHFIGSVVLAPSPDLTAAGVQRWVVVDGQQRLTSLMLLLCALRDHLAHGDPTERERFDELYLTNKWRQGLDRFRLLPTQADRDSFVACIRQAPEAGSGDGIGAAYRFFRRALVEADDPADPHDIPRLETVVRERLSIVEIAADRQDNVYRIFESLNNTGLRLSQADLVRNYLFMCLPNRGQEAYETVWLPIQESLTGDQLELLMYLDLVLRGEERVRREDLYRGHQERIRALDGEDAVVAYMEALQRRARLLRLILQPSEEPDEDVSAAIERLRAWGAQTMYPPMMALLERRLEDDASDEAVATSLLYIESFVVRRMFAAVPTQNLNRIFQALTGQILEADDVVVATRQGLSGTRLYWPTDRELREAVRTKPFYWTGRHPQRFFVLRRLEESFPSAERADLTSPKLSIEHVLPQTLTPEWLAEVAEGAEPGEDPNELARRVTHTLGNLTLTGYNPELSNSPFEVKRGLLAESNLEMNRPIAREQRWGPKQILERADDLARRAAEIWPGPDETVRGLTEGRDWEVLHQALAALPTGTWTAYSDLAELVGSHPVPVGAHIARTPILNGHRAMAIDGRISPAFRWYDENDTRDPRDVLQQEGIRFIEGRADPTQRVTASELASLLGLAEDSAASETLAPHPDLLHELDDLHARFLTQLTERHKPGASGAVARLLDHWVAQGGQLTFGTSATTSCFPILRGRGVSIWPIIIYPGSTVEVGFMYLKARPPFDDPMLRAELRRRLNQAPDIDIPIAKLELRPSFPISALTDTETFEVVRDALGWFIDVVRELPEYATEMNVGTAADASEAD
jgi:alkylated DNA nucleotide flippase Atl1